LKSLKFHYSYLDEVAQIKSALEETSAPIAKYSVGDKIDVVFKGIDPTSHDWVYTVDGNAKMSALLLSSLAGTATAPEAGSKHQVVILWIDYSSDVLLISNKKHDIAHISQSGDLPTNLVGKAGMSRNSGKWFTEESGIIKNISFVQMIVVTYFLSLV